MRVRSRLAAVGVVALLAVSACGTAENATNDPSSTTSAATQALTTDDFASTLADAQLSAQSAHLQMKIGVGGQDITAEGDVAAASDPAQSKLAMTLDAGGMGNLEMRLVDKVFYLNGGPMTSNKFAEIDLNDPNNPLAKSFGPMIDQMDPAKSVEALKGAISSVQKSGSPETIDGVRTQPYKVVIDTAKLTDSSMFGDTGTVSLPDQLTFMYWVGPDNLPRKLTSDMGQATFEATFTKWGEDVTIEAPPASQITADSPFDSMPSGAPTAG